MILIISSFPKGKKYEVYSPISLFEANHLTIKLVISKEYFLKKYIKWTLDYKQGRVLTFNCF